MERTDDRKRCGEAGIPGDKTVFKTGCEPGSDMILSAGRREQDPDGREAADFTGMPQTSDTELMMPESFIYLIFAVIGVFVRAIRVRIFLKRSPAKAVRHARYQSDIGGITAEAPVREYDGSGWKEYCFRRGTEGEKRRKVIVREVHARNGDRISAVQ